MTCLENTTKYVTFNTYFKSSLFLCFSTLRICYLFFFFFHLKEIILHIFWKILKVWKYELVKFEKYGALWRKATGVILLQNFKFTNMGGDIYFNILLIFTFTPIPSMYDEKLNRTWKKEKVSILWFWILI